MLPQIKTRSVKTCDSSEPGTGKSGERVQCKAIDGPTWQESYEAEQDCPESRK